MGFRPLSAQSPATGSRYLAVDHWAYEYIARLRDRGYLSSLNPLVQPYRRRDVARALAQIGADSLPEPARSWVRLLKSELAPELAWSPAPQQPAFGGELMAGGRGSTSRRLDPARPVGTGSAWPWWRGGAWGEVGPIAAETRLYGDTYFRDDPDGTDPGYDPRAQRGGRTDNAYISLSLPFGGADLGHLARNWGPWGSPGLMISNVATPYAQLALDLAAGPMTLRFFTAELDTVGGAKRQLVAHRLDYARPELVFSLGESILYVSPTQVLKFVNPVEFLFFDQSDDPPQNLMLNAQLWLRRGPVTVYLDGLLDDLDVSPETPKAEPPQYGFTVGARLHSLPARMELGAEYQQVGAWSYRTPNYVDRYSYFNRGLGANYSDYDRLKLWTDWYPPVSGLRLSPGVLLQRQGQGNFRDSIPGGYYWGRPALFWGIKETTLRLSLSGRYQPARFFWLAWDVGPNRVANKAHLPGRTVREFEATGELGLRLEFSLGGR